jgi:4'-phosphopantetheinyl transferase
MSDEWLLVKTLPPLEGNALQVWRLELSPDDGLFPACMSVLSMEEKQRAERLREGRVREQFVAGRWFLRSLLGEVLGVAPREVVIRTGVHGKLYTPLIGDRSVSFNVAHSRDTILIALCQQGDIGVDVEYHDAAVDITGIAATAFHPNEIRRLATWTDESQRRRAFYRCWTQKEAVAKADGRGMGLSFSTFEVPMEIVKDAAVHIGGSDGRGENVYFLHDLPMDNGISATVGVDTMGCRISTMMFPTEVVWAKCH